MKFGTILRELREKKELSQVELAKKLNITSQSLSQYELGKRMPDIDMINRLADFFNVSIDYLLGRTEIKNFTMPPIKEDETLNNINSEIINIIQEIDKLSPESQEELKKLIELYKIRDMQKRNTEFSDELATLD